MDAHETLPHMLEFEASYELDFDAWPPIADVTPQLSATVSSTQLDEVYDGTTNAYVAGGPVTIRKCSKALRDIRSAAVVASHDSRLNNIPDNCVRMLPISLYMEKPNLPLPQIHTWYYFKFIINGSGNAIELAYCTQDDVATTVGIWILENRLTMAWHWPVSAVIESVLDLPHPSKCDVHIHGAAPAAFPSGMNATPSTIEQDEIKLPATICPNLLTTSTDTTTSTTHMTNLFPSWAVYGHTQNGRCMYEIEHYPATSSINLNWNFSLQGGTAPGDIPTNAFSEKLMTATAPKIFPMVAPTIVSTAVSICLATAARMLHSEPSSCSCSTDIHDSETFYHDVCQMFNVVPTASPSTVTSHHWVHLLFDSLEHWIATWGDLEPDWSIIVAHDLTCRKTQACIASSLRLLGESPTEVIGDWAWQHLLSPESAQWPRNDAKVSDLDSDATIDMPLGSETPLMVGSEGRKGSRKRSRKIGSYHTKHHPPDKYMPRKRKRSNIDSKMDHANSNATNKFARDV